MNADGLTSPKSELAVNPQVEELMDFNEEENKVFLHQSVRHQVRIFDRRTEKSDDHLHAAKSRQDLQPWNSIYDKSWHHKDFFKNKEATYYVSKPKDLLKKKPSNGQLSDKSPWHLNFSNRFSQTKDSANFFESYRRSDQSFLTRSPVPLHLGEKTLSKISKLKSHENLFRSPIILPEHYLEKPRESTPSKDPDLPSSGIISPLVPSQKIKIRSRSRKSNEAAGAKETKVSFDLPNKINMIENILVKKDSDNSCLSLNRNPYFLGRVRRMILESSKDSIKKSSSLKKIETKRGIIIFTKKVSTAGIQNKNLLLEKKISLSGAKSSKVGMTSRI